MNNDEDIPFCEELGIDSDLVPFLGKEDINLLALKCVQYWRRAYAPPNIALFLRISTEEAEASISRIQKAMPEEMLSRDIAWRDKIIESQNPFTEKRRGFHEALQKPIDDYLAEGKDPIAALREFREYISEESVEGDFDIGNEGNWHISREKTNQSMPPLQGEQTNISIEYIQAILQKEAAASNIREHDGASEKKPKIASETPANGLSILTEDLMGWHSTNPAEIQSPFREVPESEAISSLISDLRQRDCNRIITNEEDGLGEEEELQLIAALRQEAKAPKRATNTDKYVGPDLTGIAPISIDELKRAFNPPNESKSLGKSMPTRSKTRGSHRITVRVNDNLHKRMLETANALGVDLSTVVRDLLERDLESGSDTKTNAANCAILPDVFQYSPRYRAWCGDLRLELRKQFLILLALAHESSGRWPKTPWVRQLFMALLPLQKYLEDEHVRHN
jgi:hypothetical protein